MQAVTACGCQRDTYTVMKIECTIFALRCISNFGVEGCVTVCNSVLHTLAFNINRVLNLDHGFDMVLEIR